MQVQKGPYRNLSPAGLFAQAKISAKLERPIVYEKAKGTLPREAHLHLLRLGEELLLRSCPLGGWRRGPPSPDWQGPGHGHELALRLQVRLAGRRRLPAV